MFFIGYCIFAIAYYRERVLYDTAAFLNTGPLLDGTFFRALDRLTVQIPPQLLPLLVVKLGGTSKLAAMAYSLSFALFHYCFWIMLVHVFRRRDLGLGYITILLIDLVHNDIFIQADLMHAAGFLFLFIALAEAESNAIVAGAIVRPSLMFAIGTAACFGHPLMTVMIAYYSIYAMVVKRRLDFGLVSAATASIAIYAANKVLFPDSYESGAFAKTLALSHLWESLAALPNYLIRAHWPAIGIVAICIYVVARVRRARPVLLPISLMLLTLTAAICSWIPLAHHSNWQFSGYTWMYFLSYYLVLVVPIFDTAIEQGGPLKSRAIAWFRMALLLTSFAWAIGGTVLDFHLARQRQAFIVNVRNALAGPGPAIYLLDDVFSKNPLLRENDLTLWDGSLLVSSYDGPGRACMIIPPYGWKGGSADQYRQRYLRPLNPRYFALPPASRLNARTVNSAVGLDVLMTAARDVELNYSNQSRELSYIGGAPEDYRRRLELVDLVPVTIVNHETRPFPSRVRIGESNMVIPVTIGYRWELDGRTLFEDKEAETLPIDVRTSFVHSIQVKRVAAPQGARLVLGIFAGHRFIPCANCADWPDRSRNETQHPGA